MRIKIITSISILLGLFSFTAVSQNVVVSSSKEFTNSDEYSFFSRALGQDETGYYFLRKSGPINNETIALEKFSVDFEPLFSKNIESSSGIMGDLKLHRFTEMANGKILVFLAGWNKNDGMGSLYVKELDKDANPIGGEILLTSAPGKNMLKNADFAISISPDGSKLLVSTEPMFEKKAMEKLSLEVFSTKDFSSLWKQEITFENEAERYPIHDIKVNNSGSAFVYKDVKISGKEHSYQVVFADRANVKKLALDLQGKAPSHIKLKIDRNGNLVLMGMLAKISSFAGYWDSVWFLKINTEGEIVSNKIEPLGADLLSGIVSEKEANEAGFQLKDYTLVDLLEKPNGGYILLAEQQIINEKSIDDKVPPTYEYTINYGGIPVLSFDSHGNRDWNTYFAKNQNIITRNPEMSLGSYTYFFEADNLNLVWNFTEIFHDNMADYRYWIDANGSRINIDNLFGREALYPTFLTVIEPSGNFKYTDRTYLSLPLTEIQKPNSFKMAVDPSFTFTNDSGLIILSRMHGHFPGRYKFNTIGLRGEE